jgi:hypothetical protein
MRARTFADLVLHGSLPGTSRARMALAESCPVALGNCERLGIAPPSLADAIVETLPDALDVGLAEKIRRQWLPAQAAQPAPWRAALELHTTALLDHLREGCPTLKLWLRCKVELNQAGGEVVLFRTPLSADDGEPCLQLGEGRAWNVRWLLQLSDSNNFQSSPSTTPIGIWCTGNCEAHLPPQV